MTTITLVRMVLDTNFGSRRKKEEIFEIKSPTEKISSKMSFLKKNQSQISVDAQCFRGAVQVGLSKKQLGERFLILDYPISCPYPFYHREHSTVYVLRGHIGFGLPTTFQLNAKRLCCFGCWCACRHCYEQYK